MKIDKFTDEFAFLSNFFPATILHKGIVYPTVEHAFQASKVGVSPLYNREFVRKQISLASTPGRAKRLGQKVVLRKDWNKVRLVVMSILVFKKFANYIVLKQQLLDTGDAILIEGNGWHDKFWGICDGVGQNWLGKILMEVREGFNNG